MYPLPTAASRIVTHTHTYTYTHTYTHADDEGCKLIMAVYQGGQRKKERVSIQDTS